MKFSVQISDRVSVELEADSTVDAFRAIGDIQELFGAVSVCGACGSDGVYFSSRERQTADGRPFTSHSAHCKSCRAQLDLGARRDGGLYPRRKDKQGNVIGDGGWYVYRSETGAGF